MTYYKAKTPLSTRYFTATEWIDFGETWTREDVAFVQNFSPELKIAFTLELIQSNERPE